MLTCFDLYFPFNQIYILLQNTSTDRYFVAVFIRWAHEHMSRVIVLENWNCYIKKVHVAIRHEIDSNIPIRKCTRKLEFYFSSFFLLA